MKILIFTTILFFIFTTPAHAQAVISEVYPAPTSDENEWIEIYNPTSEPINLIGLKLFEHFSKKNELISFDELVIEPNGFYTFNLESNKLNNVEEKITLENELEEVLSSLHYTNSESQKSISYLFDDNIAISNTLELTNPSKNSINPIKVLSLPSPTPIIEKVPEIITPSPTPKIIEVKITPKPTINPINHELIKFQDINQQLKIPNLFKIEKEGLIKRIPRFSYIVQKKVSSAGVINAIIGGSLIVFAGLII